MAGSNQGSFDINTVPKYRDLPLVEGTDERHAWDVFGPGDNLGTINYLTPEHVQESVKLVKRGVCFNLDLPLDQPERPQGSGNRATYQHNIYRTDGGGDDSIDNFYLQSSSQFDALTHVRFGSRGFYQGVQVEELDSTDRLGIDHWSRHGIAGRAVLLDLPRFVGPTFDVHERIAMDGPMMEAIAAKQGVEIKPKDIILLRTGWMNWYLNSKELGPERMDIRAPQPGLDGSRETAEWMWDHRITFFAGDNIAAEALPPVPRNFQHRRMVPLFGMTIGELWDFDELAEDCAKDGVYEVFLVAKPLNLPQGVGSPINALAFK
ncbi:MAG: cyclase family protein [Chloroflexota bacterium]